MISETGHCHQCGANILDYPGLACPYCSHARTHAAMAALELDPETSPAEVVVACKAALLDLYRRRKEIVALRARASRALLRSHDLGPDLKRAHSRLLSIERWASEDGRPRKCKAGHSLLEFGYLKGKRWGCSECDKVPKVVKPKLTLAERKDRARLRAAWATHDEEMARRAELLERHADDLIPERLRPTMAPPPLPASRP